MIVFGVDWRDDKSRHSIAEDSLNRGKSSGWKCDRPTLATRYTIPLFKAQKSELNIERGHASDACADAM